MAVEGLEKFRDCFEGYEDCYTIIGGTACDILMSETEFDFRATKDIDMIILLEDRYQEFAQIFWNFIAEGGIVVVGNRVASLISIVSQIRNQDILFRLNYSQGNQIIILKYLMKLFPYIFLTMYQVYQPSCLMMIFTSL